MPSDAIPLDRVSRVVGYKITKGVFNPTSPNLPQRIAILAEANQANQGSLSLTPIELTSAQQAGNLFGFGSPIYQIMRILRPILGGEGVGAIPTIVYPQAQAANATPRILNVVPVGVATGNATHTLRIAGRGSIDGYSFDINIVTGDTAATISVKIANAINAVLGAPCLAGASGYNAILTTKWAGLTANEFNVTVDTGTPANPVGISYSVVLAQSAIATPSVAAQLQNFRNDWNTIVINGYGLVSSVLADLETFNGIPDSVSPTGRYTGFIMRPFIAISGSVLDDPSLLADARLNNCTIAVAPAPSSPGFSFEAAANMALLFAIQAQNNPHLDINGRAYSDMPVPVLTTSFVTMADYNNREIIVERGCSTVDLVSGAYVVQDFVTTYHPVGENPPQFRYCRNLNVDFNIKFSYFLLQDANLRDRAIVGDNDSVSVSNVIKPKMWKSIVYGFAEELASRALITQPDFMQDSIVVNIGTTNPDRLETQFKYKRTGIARIASTTVEAGFNFGTV